LQIEKVYCQTLLKKEDFVASYSSNRRVV